MCAHENTNLEGVTRFSVQHTVKTMFKLDAFRVEKTVAGV
jgi:hypothetical protein